MTQQQTAIDFFRALIEREQDIQQELRNRFELHPNSSSTIELKKAIKNRFNERQERVKIANLDAEGLECFFYIQNYGIAHNWCGAEWSEDRLLELAEC